MKDLLPRLHEVDSYSLSGWAEGKLTSADRQGDAELVGKSARRGDEKQAGLFSIFSVSLSCKTDTILSRHCNY